MTFEELKKAFTQARRPGTGPGRVPASVAIVKARAALARVEEARRIYEEAEGAGADSHAPGAIPASSEEARKARTRLVDTMARAGLFNDANAWRPRWTEEDSAFRGTLAAHDVRGAGVEHRGWFTNPDGESFRDGSGLCWGVICQLSGRKGLERWVAGYQFGGVEGGPSLVLTTVYTSPPSGFSYEDSDAKGDAARAADSMAERAAESEKEYQTAFRAGSDWSDKGEELERIRGKLLKAIPEFKAAHMPNETPTLDSMFRRQVSDLLAKRSELMQERQELAEGDSPGLYFYLSEELKGAFCEGAGLDRFPGDTA